jgi:aspartate/methionine/tyrosine aminotransferase
MLPETPKRLDAIAPFYVMNLLARARELESQGHDVIHLEIGEPDFKTPDPVVEAGIQAMRDGNMGYTAANGIPELRQAIARFYHQTQSVTVDPNRIFITTGASGALQLAMLACLDNDDALLLTEPGYPCNRHIAEALGLATQVVDLDAKGAYLPTIDQLSARANHHTKALLLASPGNPTGSVIPTALMQEVSDLCADNHWHLIMDEIYSSLVFGGQQAKTVLSVNPGAWVVQSFSKYFQMTGWRLGWLVVPEGYEAVVSKLAQNLFLSAPTVAQYAAVAAFEPGVMDTLEQRRRLLASRRDFLVAGLESIGFPVVAAPDGAFYLYVDVSAYTDDSLAFCTEMLEQAHVAVAPGLDFGGVDARTTVRFAYTQEVDQLSVALTRMGDFIQKWSQK